MTHDLPTIPKPDTDAIDAATVAFLRADAIIAAINANLPPGSTSQILPIPKEYMFKKVDRETVSVAFHAAFQLCGGVPKLAQWAAAEPEKFFPLYAKLLPAETAAAAGGTQINFISAIPETPQDRVTIDARGLVIAADTNDADLPE